MDFHNPNKTVKKNFNNNKTLQMFKYLLPFSGKVYTHATSKLNYYKKNSLGENYILRNNTVFFLKHGKKHNILLTNSM